MKRLLLVLILTLASVGCGTDEPAAPLTEAEYAAQGNAICDQMNADLDALAIRASGGVSPEEERDIFNDAQTLSRDAIDALFDLPAPSSFAEGRQSLVLLVDERRDLIQRWNDGEDLFAELAAVNSRFEAAAKAIWPRCAA